MYCKQLDNFCFHHSDKSKRGKRQKSRFQRACRSVFYNRGNNKKSHRFEDNIPEKLHRARQHRFLFLPSQQIYKPLQHLKYHKRLVLRDEKYYNFPILPDSIGTLPILDPPLRLCSGNVLTSISDTQSSTNNSQPILSNDENTWHEKLSIWIPTDLFPYITDEPVYISKRQAKLKGQYHTPGCVDWLKDQEADEAAKHLYNKDLLIRAKLWGTSINSIEYREGIVKDLTEFQDHFHKKITALMDRQTVLHDRIKQGKNVYKSNKQLLQLEQEFGQFKIDYFSVMDDNAYHYRYKGHTSDNTKQLELRPKKRSPVSPTNLDRPVTSIKKMRPDTLSPEDFKVFASF
ncbi:hypothetical protein RhiirA5_437987 [Rhizophagus irregularis]|uniref:DUF8211 domain-containing protein n=1 Tax=Rhizophagus irregularis TaxID=588596 RepID=A0A2N0NJR5_9GLOM|nr:hypothetical protein RhiirA5_437987 [Rhizophagus irregularis]